MPRKQPPAKLSDSPKPRRSAIYRLNPQQRRFVLTLAKGGTQTDAYQIAYGCEKEAAEAGASRLIRDPLVMEAMADMIQESLVFETETREKIAARFAKLAEESGRDSDKIRANELLAKVHPERFLDESQKTAVIIADTQELDAIRARLRAAGKYIEPVKKSNAQPELTVDEIVDTPNTPKPATDDATN